jgi:hypothetical protein
LKVYTSVTFSGYYKYEYRRTDISKGMLTQFLYPLTYPLDKNDKFLYLTALKSVNKKYVHDLIRQYHIFIDIEIPITKNETLTMSLKVLRLLDRDNANPILKYKVMYRNTDSNLRIRSDNGHIGANGRPFPHIDLEIPNKGNTKMVFDTDPSDYEASVNTVLRYAERFSPMIGVDYWLHNLTNFRRDQIHFLFRTHQRSLNISTAITDVARLVSVDLWTRKGEYIYHFNDFNQLIASKFVRCLGYERTKRRPLKISKNLIQQKVDMNLFPCPVILNSTDGPLKPRVLNIMGNELPSDSVRLLGKTTYENVN